MGVAVPWLILLAFQSYQHGYKQNKMPEPFYFLGASGAMAIAGLVGMWNPTIGTLFAWALLTGAFVSGQAKSVPAGTETVAFRTGSTKTNPGSLGSVGTGGLGILPNVPGPPIGPTHTIG